MIEVLPEVVDPDRRLGRHVRHDPRSKAYRFRAAAPTVLRTVEHLPAIPPMNQGNLGSCVANTGTELLATQLFAAVRPPKLDDGFVHDLYRELTRTDPFDGVWEPDDTGSDGTTLGKIFVARGYASGYQHAMDLAAFLTALQTTAVPIGIAWRAGCDAPNGDGLIRWSGPYRGGHEILAVGYDADRQWVLLLNHWGGAWGLGGKCWMTVADVAAALANRGDATIINPIFKPTPPPEPNPDADLAATFRAWRPGVTSRTTKAGRLAQAGDAWLAAKGI